jgi:hypothetical protein
VIIKERMLRKIGFGNLLAIAKEALKGLWLQDILSL